ncbi:biopolymer transporter ExbD [Moraxella atlantae]|uniref:Biopolymer transporter ExbD n=1 Tax=Faucicola atlantae TaxID=34059 RepID=A0A1B8Q8K5_9GAMM|nr:biopolymer transporter ExbD [Moraxella atlantae]OBX73066.1 biopolymer transporter ExbD [Moraxella atlantae]
MRFRRPSVEPVEINLTPMIDCLLFLIVFLLLSMTFNHFSKLNIVLPQAEGVPIVEKDKRIEVSIQKDGSYAVNGIALSGTGAGELAAMVRQEAGDDRNMLFVISADADATHQSVVRAMDVAGSLGFINLNISTVIPAGAAVDLLNASPTAAKPVGVAR